MFILGLDTGGTYTDAVLLDPAGRTVHAKAKVFTTRENLASCIGDAIAALPAASLADAAMLCVSTTLATNAVVEGDHGRVGVLSMGRDPEGKLPAVLWRRLDGLLDMKGRVVREVDQAQAARAAEEMRGNVDAVAVSGFASIRNADHENQVRDIVQRILDVPVVCAHELSSSLGHYQRTVTAAINAGLIPKIDALIQAVRRIAGKFNLHCPIMVVRGDGSLISAEAARTRPIETILSGPAASIVGALYLSGIDDALLLDMGGTTTDIACARSGLVKMNNAGAVVGGWRTMVRAAEIATFGLGGDSLLQIDADGSFRAGPQRVQPLCVAAARWPNIEKTLQRYSRLEADEISLASHLRFYRLPDHPDDAGEASRWRGSGDEGRIVAALADGPLSRAEIAETLDEAETNLPLENMVRAGGAAAISLTPTDLLHASGQLNLWNAAAARAGVEIAAKKIGSDPETAVAEAKRAITEQLLFACVASAALFDGDEAAIQSPTLRRLVASALTGAAQVVQPAFKLALPVVGVGAPAAAWLPDACATLQAKLVTPEHAEVANAVGAAVGQIRVRTEALVRPDRENAGFAGFSHLGRRDFADRGEAESWALASAREQAVARAAGWGGGTVNIEEKVEPKFFTDSAGNAVYIETMVTVEAIGNPSAIQDCG